MIIGLLSNSPKSISEADLQRHQSEFTTFYIIALSTFNKNGICTGGIESFGDQKLLEVAKGCKVIQIIPAFPSRRFERLSTVELTVYNNKSAIQWHALGFHNEEVIITKYVSEEEITEFRIEFLDSSHILISVCEIPPVLKGLLTPSS